MFSSLGLFKKVACPVGPACHLSDCLFDHEEKQGQQAWHEPPSVPAVVDESSQVPNKRRKVDDAPALARLAARTRQEPFLGKLVKSPPASPREAEVVELRPSRDQKRPRDRGQEPSAEQDICQNARPVSPPQLRRPVTKPKSRHLGDGWSPATVNETLNPRSISRPPASHSSRMLYLTKLHEFMSRLNGMAAKSTDPTTRAVALDQHQLIRLALDEEEQIALGNASIYPNLIKLRMVAVSKMPLEQWRAERELAQSSVKGGSGSSASTSTPKAPIDLSLDEQFMLLPRLFADQSGLARFGYVTAIPTPQEVLSAEQGVAAAHHWEQCDRCASRFQAFPARAGDGSLTTGGKCTYHHGRPVMQQTGKMNGTRQKVKTYSCCNDSMGTSVGCVTHDTHVYKVSDSKRLASVLQFEHTPSNLEVPSTRAVAFDCEMAYTVHGMELLRLTATNWPDGEELLDVLVKPYGAILDLNTRFSGVKTDQFVDALPYDGSVNSVKDSRLRIVDSPAAARSLLFGLISPSTPLIGHAIENDLNVTRIVHPSIIDTCLLYPSRYGLPYRRALRQLSEEFLGRQIQLGGANGHDSKEDANAAMDLVRLLLGKKWRSMKRHGCRFEDGRLVEPDDLQKRSSTADPPTSAGVASVLKRVHEGSSDESKL